VISAYESGARHPSLPVLEKLVAATGLELELRIRRTPSTLNRLTGPLGRKVRAHRAEIRDLCAKSGAKNVRVFGSVARGQETALSDIDLFALVALRGDLERLLDAGIDLVPAVSLKDGVRHDVMRDMVRL
jgi:predicted nucleotidyltransferase